MPRVTTLVPSDAESESSSGSGTFVPKDGALVDVESRTWAGINKPGGVGKVIAVHTEEGSSYPYAVDVRYVLGGVEKNVEMDFVKEHKELARGGRRRGRARESQGGDASPKRRQKEAPTASTPSPPKKQKKGKMTAADKENAGNIMIDDDVTGKLAPGKNSVVKKPSTAKSTPGKKSQTGKAIPGKKPATNKKSQKVTKEKETANNKQAVSGTKTTMTKDKQKKKITDTKETAMKDTKGEGIQDRKGRTVLNDIGAVSGIKRSTTNAAHRKSSHIEQGRAISVFDESEKLEMEVVKSKAQVPPERSEIPPRKILAGRVSPNLVPANELKKVLPKAQRGPSNDSASAGLIRGAGGTGRGVRLAAHLGETRAKSEDEKPSGDSRMELTLLQKVHADTEKKAATFVKDVVGGDTVGKGKDVEEDEEGGKGEDTDCELQVDYRRHGLFCSLLNQVMMRQMEDCLKITVILDRVNKAMVLNRSTGGSKPLFQSGDSDDSKAVPFTNLEIRSYLQCLHDDNKVMVVWDSEEVYTI